MDTRTDIGPDLIDRIYEAAFVPEFWPGVIEKLAAVSGSAAGSLLLYEDTKPVRFTGIGATRDVVEAFASSGRWKENRRIQYFHQNPFTGFVTAAGYFSREFLENEIGFEDRARFGLDDQVGTMMAMPSGELVVVALDRRAADGMYSNDDVRRLNAIHPHLARAGLMAARLGLEQARGMASAFQAIGLPAAILSRSGRVQAANELLDAMTSVFLPTAFGGVAIADPGANDLFRQAIEAAGGSPEPVVRSIPVKARGGSPPLVVHVLPLRRSAHDIFSGADTLVAATAVGASSLVPSPTVLTGLFDLAPSEARLAAALTRGTSLKDFAAEAGITFGTARRYLDNIYLKTGTHRQGELVALLKGAGPIGPP